jgi:hypothetical protein
MTQGNSTVIYRFKRTVSCFALLPALLAAGQACADILVDAGERALLTVSIAVDGGVEELQGHRDEVVKWSTRRAFNATVEMVADKAETMSVSGSHGGAGQALLADIQKQSEACGQDQACQMRVAMQMMNNPAMQETIDAPPRYQAWRPVEEGARLDVSGSHEETLHTVFYTAARETTDCTLTAPKISPELTKDDIAGGRGGASASGAGDCYRQRRHRQWLDQCREQPEAGQSRRGICRGRGGAVEGGSALGTEEDLISGSPTHRLRPAADHREERLHARV